jgi:dipeptidyl aminopeptidase/acylaminoacyl peptidase
MPDPKRTITAEDLYRFTLISEPQLSPDGTLVVYVLDRVDRKTEKKYANLWIVPVEGGEPRPFTTGDQSDTRPRFSPDGRRIAFLSNRDDEKQPQVYVIATDGGEARRVTDLKGQIRAFEWSPDGIRLLLEFRAKDADEIEREKDEEKKKLGVVCREITRVFFKEDGSGFLPKARAHLWIVDVASGEATPLTSGPVYDEWGASWSPNGEEIAFLSNHAADPDLDPDATDLFVVGAAGGEARRIEAPLGPKIQPRFSPDGTQIAYLGREGRGKGYRQIRLWVVPLQDGKAARCLTAEHDLNIVGSTINDMGGLAQVPPTWSPDGKRITVQVSHHGTTVLKSVGLDGSLEDVIDAPGVVGTYSYDRSGRRLVALQGSFTDPGQVILHEDGASRALTRANAGLLGGIDLGKIEEVWFKGPEGNDLQGWILTPPGFDPNRRYPSILEIHGGPRTQYGNHFMHEFYFLAARGYVVTFCNPRGGQGYGEAHSKAIWNAWGTADYADVMAWADLVAKRPYIDTARMGVTGGSYGGYMTNWIIGHTDRFAAAVTQRSVSNLISMYGSSDFNWAFQEEFGDVPPWEALESYWWQSPIAFIGNAKTPTLVIHSEQDLRCAIEQGEQVFVALKRLGVDTKLVRFPDEPHGLSRGGRTDRRVARLEHIVGWFDRYLKSSEM